MREGGGAGKAGGMEKLAAFRRVGKARGDWLGDVWDLSSIVPVGWVLSQPPSGIWNMCSCDRDFPLSGIYEKGKD